MTSVLIIFGIPSRQPVVDLTSPIYAMLMIQFFLLKLTSKIAKASKKCQNHFVIYLASKLACPNPKYSSPPMFPNYPMTSFVRPLVFKLPQTQVRSLGFPLKQPGSTGHDFDFIIDRVKTKLAGWKSNLLSMARRCVLTNFVTSTILAYVMQGTILPARIHNALDKINRNFIWGSTDERRKIHLVGWNKVIGHKEEGGLGIKATKLKNLSLTTKLCWRFKNCKRELWAETLKRKYLNRNHPTKHGFSRTWSAINKSEEICSKGSHQIIGNKSNLSFWYDKWTTFGPLKQLIQGPFTLAKEKLLVKNTMVDGQWDCSQISFMILDSWLMILKAIPLRKASDSKDILCWDGKAKGLFYSKHAYNLAFGDVGPTFSFDG